MQKGVLVIPVDNEPLFFIEKGTERAKMETPLSDVFSAVLWP
jgi:hypothetical protein